MGLGQVGFRDGLLEDEIDGSLEPLLRVNGQLLHLLHQLLKVLRGQLVEDGAEALEQAPSLDLL